MSNEHTSVLAFTPQMTLADMLTALLDHFEASDTDNCEFEFPGFDETGKQMRLAFTVSLKAVQ